jgi:amino acid adenylation domain-containing protein
MTTVIQNKVPISYYQKFFWLEWKLDPHSPKYNTSLSYRIYGDLKEEALQRALNTYINKFHEAARGFFDETAITVEQIIEENLNICLKKEILSFPLKKKDEKNSEDDVLRGITDFIARYCHCSFNLANSPLFKFGLLKVADKDFILVLSFHHIVTDAFTAVFLVQVVSALYNHYAYGAPLPYVKSDTFLEYILKEEVFYPFSERKADLKYWRGKLANKNLRVPLVAGLSSIALAQQSVGSYSFSIDVENTKLLKQLAAKEGTTLFIVITSIFFVLLYRYTQQKDLCISYVVNTRPVGFKKLPGCFVNIVPVALNIEGENTFQELIHTLTLERKESKAHQRCSLVDIMQFLKKEGVINANDHLNVGISEGFLNSEPLNLEGLNVKCFSVNNPENANDFLLLYQENDTLQFKINYQKKLFKESFIQQVSQHFQCVLEKCIENVQQDITCFSLLSDKEKQIILKNWNHTEKLLPQDRTIHQLFEDQVRRVPNNIAVCDDDQMFTFDSVNRKANQLARAIKKTFEQDNERERQNKSQPVVAICLDRSLALVVGILGVLKAQACYLPIDPEDIASRMLTMLEDAKVDLILTLKKNLKEKSILKNFKKLILLDSDWRFISKFSDEDFLLSCSSRDLAYIIYTSGTTGVPKGVMVEHKSVVNIILDIQDKFNVTEKDRIFNLAPMAFDIYGLELFLALLSGACHIICSSVMTRDPKQIAERITKTNPTIVNASPTLWSILLKFLKRKKRNFTIFSTAEPLSFSLAKKLKILSNNVWDLYGPTETTMVSSFERIENRPPGIGRGFANTKLYVLDEYLNPVPIGAIGELYISGMGVARGYLHDAKLTEPKFIKNILLDTDECLMYKTGDYVRWREEGTLEYLGRDDRQIKV